MTGSPATTAAATLDARAGNAVLRRIRAWTALAEHLDRDLAALLKGTGEVVELLAGVRHSAVIRAPHVRAAADLFVLLDQGRLYAGRELSVVPLGSWTYRLTDVAGATGDAAARVAARDLTDQVTRGRPVGYQAWPGRIDRIAVITHNRPDTLARALDAFLSNLRRFGRGYVEVVVYDDSAPTVRRQVRSVVAAAGAGGARVRYVGPEEKHALRAAFENGLPGQVGAEDRQVLDRLLGVLDPDGTWTGSAAEQRNWAILSHAGKRVLVCDDDIRPEVLDAPLSDQRTAARAAVDRVERPPRLGARLWAGELLTGHLTTTALAPWQVDLLGILEEEERAGLASARYTGHPDRRSALLLERFFELSDRSIDVCDTAPPQLHVRQAALAGGPRKFRGGAFATSGGTDGVAFAVRRERNEDFGLALSQLITTQGRLRPGESGRAHMRHERGARHCGPFAAHRQEREGDLVNRLIGDLARAYQDAHPNGFDPRTFCEYGLALIDDRVGRAAAELAEDLFRDGMAYRSRALSHLHALAALDARIAAARAAGRAPPARLSTRWYGDRAATRAALLRAGARRLRARRALPAPILAECMQVLVPEGIMPLVNAGAMRRQLRALSPGTRAAAARLLDDEARWCTEPFCRPGGGVAPPIDFRDRISVKTDRTRQLVAEIDTELGISTRGDGAARPRFAAGVRARVDADVRLFLRAMPYADRLQADLHRLVAARW